MPQAPSTARFRPPGLRRIASAAILALGVFLVYFLSPNVTTFDSRWVVHTAASLLREGNFDLNEYLPQLERDGFYAIECIQPDGTRVFRVTDHDQCRNGRYFHFFPVAVPLLSTPGVAAIDALLSAAYAWLPPRPRRDVVAYAQLAELILGSAFASLGVGLFFLLASRFTSFPTAMALSALLAFGSPAWSTASPALWMHGPSNALHSLVMLMLVAGERNKRWIDACGAVLACAFFVRPTNAVLVLVCTIYVAMYYRDRFFRFVAWAAPVTALFAALNWTMYRSLLAPYFFVNRGPAGSLSLDSGFGSAMAGQLLSLPADFSFSARLSCSPSSAPGSPSAGLVTPLSASRLPPWPFTQYL